MEIFPIFSQARTSSSSYELTLQVKRNVTIQNTKPKQKRITEKIYLFVQSIRTVSYNSTKGWFPYDSGSQIAIMSAIVCDHMETTSAIVCDPRTMFYLRAVFHMITDDRRPYCDLRSAIRDHMETSLKK